MPIYDNQCLSCSHEFESINSMSTQPACPKCSQPTKRLIAASGHFCSNDDAPWIRKVLEVVDKDSASPHTREFINNPTRANYKRWMKGEGVRHLESGERPSRPNESQEHQRKVDHIMRQYQREEGVSVG